MPTILSNAKLKLLKAGLQIFSNCGYAGASVQEIVREAGLAKPALYYYFGSKEGLLRALVLSAHDERYELMKEAALCGKTIEEKLIGILDAMFRYTRAHKELTRLCYTTAFAAPGEIPSHSEFMNRGYRNFDFVRSLIQDAIRKKEINANLDLDVLTRTIYGHLLMYSLALTLSSPVKIPDPNPNDLVQLFMNGAKYS